MNMSEEQLKGLAAQLGNPTGEMGMMTAAQMHASNIGMTRATVAALNLTTGDKLLELGHGGGAHIPEIIETAPNLQYYGLEISELMRNEASKTAQRHQAFFELYDGSVIPYTDNFFDKVMTVNTLYFWKDPVAMLNEIHRVLKPGGKFCCTFALEDFMEKLPFTKYGFDLYSEEKFTELAKASAFKGVTFTNHTEHVTAKDGQQLERAYCVAALALKQ